MADRLFPDDDAGILTAAMTFANGIAADPARYMLVASDAHLLLRVANEYKDAYFAAKDKATRTQAAVNLKNQTQTSAKQAIRAYAGSIRANAGINDQSKIDIGVMPHKTTMTRRTCPTSSPVLKFLGSTPGMHHVAFSDSWTPNARKKPFGAVRLELFMMVTDPAEPVPTAYDEDAPGSKYLRSYTKSRVQLAHPQPAAPMLVTYFARWADSTGEVGPFSLALPTTIVGSRPRNVRNIAVAPLADVANSLPAIKSKLKRAA